MAWQVMQVAPRAPAWGSRWHDAHSGVSVRNDLVLWHFAQSDPTSACFPSRAKPVSSKWSKPVVSRGRMSASRPACSAWHMAHSSVTSRCTPILAAIRAAMGLWHERHFFAETPLPGSWQDSQVLIPSRWAWAVLNGPGESSAPRSCAVAGDVHPPTRNRKVAAARSERLVVFITVPTHSRGRRPSRRGESR